MKLNDLSPEILSLLNKAQEVGVIEEVNSIDLSKLCFQKQLEFIEDKNQFVVAVTGRRAGKTVACAMDLLWTAEQYPRTVGLYITLARTNAKRIIWPILKELIQDLKITATVNEADLSITLENGSRIYVSGASTSSEVDRFLGLALKLAYVDESQSFGRYLQDLVDRVLVPCLFDYKGKLKLIGTPPPVPTGFFHDAYNNEQWSRHHWTMFENPWIQKKRGESPEEILRQELKRKGVTEDDPTIQREVFGRFVTDTRRLVIEYSQDRNHFTDLQYQESKPTKHILGIDLGFQDADAIAVIGYSDHSPVTYLVDEKITVKQGISELIAQVEQLRQTYSPHKLVIDTGGLGLKIAEEMRRRHRIPVQAADKKRKFENIEFFNDALRTKRFMAKRTSRFANDAGLLEWDIEKATPDKKFVSDRFHSDIIDAVLYAFKESPAYAYEAPIIKPKYGTKEWADAETNRMEEEAKEHFERLQDSTMLEYL